MPRESRRMAATTPGSEGGGGGVANNLTTVDVYELASAIGGQFEKLIDNYGPESVTTLMPMVIRVLEHLEDMAQSSETDREETVELKFTVDRLLTEKKQKADERQKYEKELELIEDSWKSELRVLRDTVSRLQDENHRLGLTLRDKIIDATSQADEENRVQELLAKLNSLQDTVHRQRDEMRTMERELMLKNNDIEMLQTRVSQLTSMTEDQRRRCSVSQRQAQQLIEDKADLQAALHDKEQELCRVRDTLRRQRSSDTNTAGSLPMASGTKVCHEPGAAGCRLSSSCNEVFPDVDSTLSQSFSAADELQPQYTPECASVEPGSVVKNEEELDPPVQGPINREPDEKLHPERFRMKESGIQRFFNKFLRSKSSSSRAAAAVQRKPADSRASRQLPARTDRGSVSMDSIPRSVLFR